MTGRGGEASAVASRPGNSDTVLYVLYVLDSEHSQSAGSARRALPWLIWNPTQIHLALKHGDQ